MFGIGNNQLMKSSLSAGFNLSDYTYDSVTTVPFRVGIANGSRGISIQDGGTKFYIARGIRGVDYFTLSTADDLSTKTFINTFYVDTPITNNNPRDVSFNEDGSKSFITLDSSGGKSVREYDVITPYILSTAVDSGEKINASFLECSQFLESGSTLITLTNSESLNKYGLSTAYDLSTEGSSTNSDISDSAPNLTFWISEDGLTILIGGGDYGLITQYSMDSFLNFSSMTYVADIETSLVSSDDCFGICFNSDKSKMYVSLGETIKTYTL